MCRPKNSMLNARDLLKPKNVFPTALLQRGIVASGAIYNCSLGSVSYLISIAISVGLVELDHPADHMPYQLSHILLQISAVMVIAHFYEVLHKLHMSWRGCQTGRFFTFSE